MASDVDHVNNALVLLRAAPIASFTDDADRAQSAKLIYETTRASVIAEYPWRGFMKKVQLGLLTDAPLNEFTNAHQMPSDIVGNTFALYNSTAQNVSPVLHFRQFERQILSNEDPLYMDYKALVNEAEWPAYFTQLMIYELCWKLALTIKGDQGLSDHWVGIARGTPSEGGKGGYFGVATHTDAMGTMPQRVSDFTLIDARFGGERF